LRTATHPRLAAVRAVLASRRRPDSPASRARVGRRGPRRWHAGGLLL